MQQLPSTIQPNRGQMLYVKIDNNGNPTTHAMSYDELQIAENSIFPAVSIFEELIEKGDLSYAKVPFSPLPAVPAGKKPVQGVPVKNADGTYSRKIQFVDATEEEISSASDFIRSRREIILNKHVDNISPLRWAEMTEAQQAEIASWRQSLLDMTEDPSFPYITIPAKPSFL